MRRFGRRLKSFTAMLLSACLVFPLGAVNAWAEGPEAAEAAAEIEAVTEIGPGAAGPTILFRREKARQAGRGG